MNTIIIEKKKGDYKSQIEVEGFKFVLKARSKDKTREILQSVVIDEGLVVATDGNRLHMFMSHIEVESGIYKVISSKINQIILEKSNLETSNYPAYQKVIPEPNFNSKLHCNGSHHSLFHFVYREIASETISFNTDYLHDAYMENSDISIMQNAGYSPMVIYDNDRRAAIIMPIKNN